MVALAIHHRQELQQPFGPRTPILRQPEILRDVINAAPRQLL